MKQTRASRAKELLETASRGPAFDEGNREAFTAYRIWSSTWLMPELARLIPELKNAKLPPIGTRQLDPFWDEYAAPPKD